MWRTERGHVRHRSGPAGYLHDCYRIKTRLLAVFYFLELMVIDATLKPDLHDL